MGRRGSRERRSKRGRPSSLQKRETVSTIVESV
jgi:hypothetical protein